MPAKKTAATSKPIPCKVEALPADASACHVHASSWVNALICIPRLKGLHEPSVFFWKQVNGEGYEIFVRVCSYSSRGRYRVSLVCSLGVSFLNDGLQRLAIEVRDVPELTGGRWYHFKPRSRCVRYVPVNADEEI